MNDRCVQCGGPLQFDGPYEEAGTCPLCDAPEILGIDADIAHRPAEPPAAPTAPLHLRLGEGGIDFLGLFALDVLGAILAPLTLTASGVLPALIGAIYWAVRDLDGGRFSLGKRATRLRVVDRESGEVASREQALVRNSIYIAGWLLAALPDPFGYLGWIFLFLALTIDLVLVVGHPSRRRLGDVLAGTEVLPEENP